MCPNRVPSPSALPSPARFCARCLRLLWLRPLCPDPTCRNHVLDALPVPPASPRPHATGMTTVRHDDFPVLPRRRYAGACRLSPFACWIRGEDD